VTVQEQASAALDNVPFLQWKGKGLEDTDPLVWCAQHLECYKGIRSYTRFALTPVWG